MSAAVPGMRTTWSGAPGMRGSRLRVGRGCGVGAAQDASAAGAALDAHGAASVSAVGYGSSVGSVCSLGNVGTAWRAHRVWSVGAGGCIFRSLAEHVGSDSPGRGRSTPKVAEPRHEPRAQHAVALARSAKPGPRAKPGANLIRMRPTSHPRRYTSRPTCPKRSPPQLQQPIFASSHQSGQRFEQQPNASPPTQRPNMGGFATIGPRHAGDTPPEASYGSNSPRSHT